jgi:hypothetical protein
LIKDIIQLTCGFAIYRDLLSNNSEFDGESGEDLSGNQVTVIASR